MRQIRTALMGLTGVGEDYLGALQTNDHFELVAAGDTDRVILRNQERSIGCEVFEDFRSMIIETAHRGLDLLVVALPPFQSKDLMTLAAERSVTVLHTAPFARTVADAQSLRSLFERHRARFIVSRPQQADETFRRLGDLSALLGRVALVSAQVSANEDATGWRGDFARAGGGVLLNSAFEQIGLIIDVMQLPDTVDAECNMRLEPGSPHKYDTEDSAAVMMRFPGGCVGCLTAWRGSNDSAWQVSFVGTNGTIDIFADRIVVDCEGFRGTTNEVVRRTPSVNSVLDRFVKMLDSAEPPLESQMNASLATLSVIEAAYLSSKTGQPESPSQFM